MECFTSAYDGRHRLILGCVMVAESAENCVGIEGCSQREPRNLNDVLFSRHAGYFAVVCLLSSLFLPPDGLGVTVCWFKSCFGLPCPGCGLTRSVTCISHLEFVKAWNYHPFGPVIYVLFVANVVLLVVPKARRESLKNTIRKNNRWLYAVYMAFVLAFLTFGCLRLLHLIDSSKLV